MGKAKSQEQVEEKDPELKEIFRDGPFTVSINFDKPDFQVNIEGYESKPYTIGLDWESWVEYYRWYLKGKESK